MSDTRAKDFDPYHVWLAIPPEEQPPDHYRLLGLNRFESNPDVIESAADRQMRHLDSFKTGPRAALSQQLLNEISVAKACLLNAAIKAEYDCKLRTELSASTPVAEPPTVNVTATPIAFTSQKPLSGEIHQIRPKKTENPARKMISIILGGIGGTFLAGLILWSVGKLPYKLPWEQVSISKKGDYRAPPKLQPKPEESKPPVSEKAKPALKPQSEPKHKPTVLEKKEKTPELQPKPEESKPPVSEKAKPALKPQSEPEPKPAVKLTPPIKVKETTQPQKVITKDGWIDLLATADLDNYAIHGVWKKHESTGVYPATYNGRAAMLSLDNIDHSNLSLRVEFTIYSGNSELWLRVPINKLCLIGFNKDCRFGIDNVNGIRMWDNPVNSIHKPFTTGNKYQLTIDIWNNHQTVIVRSKIDDLLCFQWEGKENEITIDEGLSRDTERALAIALFNQANVHIHQLHGRNNELLLPPKFSNVKGAFTRFSFFDSYNNGSLFVGLKVFLESGAVCGIQPVYRLKGKEIPSQVYGKATPIMFPLFNPREYVVTDFNLLIEGSRITGIQANFGKFVNKRLTSGRPSPWIGKVPAKSGHVELLSSEGMPIIGLQGRASESGLHALGLITERSEEEIEAFKASKEESLQKKS